VTPEDVFFLFKAMEMG